jgi:hypothetical protein
MEKCFMCEQKTVGRNNVVNISKMLVKKCWQHFFKILGGKYCQNFENAGRKNVVTICKKCWTEKTVNIT